MTLARNTMLLTLLAAAVSSSALADQQFSLSIPGNAEAAASAVLTSTGTLWVNHNGGVQRYERAPRHDSRDGSYAGFLCTAKDRVIRWPASGVGPIISLKSGVWTTSKMLALPVAAAPAVANPAAGIATENVQPIMGMPLLTSASPASVTNYTPRNFAMPTMPFGSYPASNLSPRNNATATCPTTNCPTGVCPTTGMFGMSPAAACVGGNCNNSTGNAAAFLQMIGIAK